MRLPWKKQSPINRPSSVLCIIGDLNKAMRLAKMLNSQFKYHNITSGRTFIAIRKMFTRANIPSQTKSKLFNRQMNT